MGEREGCGYVTDVARLTRNMTTRHSKHVEKQQPNKRKKEEEPFNTTSYISPTTTSEDEKELTQNLVERDIRPSTGCEQKKKQS